MSTIGPPKLVRLITRMNIGGPARHVTILTARCGPDFAGVLLAGEPERREGSMAGEANRVGVDVVPVPNLRRSLSPVADLLACAWLVRYFLKERPAIVATHMAKAGTLGRIAAALTGVPVVVHTFHGHVLDGYFSRLSTFFFLSVERILSRFTTQFIAISPEVAADLDRLGIGRGKTSIVRLGLELERLTGAKSGSLRQDLGVPRSAPLVGIVGRLVPIKALDLFLAAAAQIVKTNPDIHFAIVGDGELWDRLHGDVATLGLNVSVHFAGWRQDLPEVYSDLDVVVCCSRNEGTPVSLIEACAAGRAVVGTQVGGIPDIIAAGVNGLLVPSGDPAALAAAITGLIADPGRRRSMGLAGRQMVMDRYGSERMVSELKQVYARLLERATLKAEPA